MKLSQMLLMIGVIMTAARNPTAYAADAASRAADGALPRTQSNPAWEGPLVEDVDQCFYLSEKGIIDLKVSTPDGSLPVKKVEELPLVFNEPCFVSTGKYAFKVDEEGCYRFLVCPSKTFQRIYYKANIPRFAGSIGELHIHGWRDNAVPLEKNLERAKTVCLSITCGFIREVAIALFKQQGIEAREVSTFTIDQWNHFDCGHALFEYLDPQEKRWILADSDVGYVFRADGRLLDTDEVCRQVRDKKPWEMVPINSGEKIDLVPVEDPKPNQVFTFYGLRSTGCLDRNLQRTWFMRAFQVPQMGEDYTVDTDAQKKRFEALCGTANLKYNYLSPEKFREKYYPQPAR